MSSEPERPVEKLLRACAKERRDQAGSSWEIHPAARRLLQQEVARLLGRRPGTKETIVGWLPGQWWLRLVAGLAVMVMLGVAAWLLVPSLSPRKNESLLAKNEPPQSSLASKLPQISVSDESARKVVESDKRADRSKEPLADNAIVTQRAEALDSAARDSSVGKDGLLAGEPLMAKKELSGVTPNRSANSLEDSTRSASSGLAPAALAESQSPGFAQRYGLSRGIQPASGPPSAAASLGVAMPNPETPLALVKESPKPPSAIPAQPSSVQDGPSTDLVRYGFFAGVQTPINKSRVFQQLTQRASGTAANGASAGRNVRIDKVLVSFRVEQSGREFRIIDSDDSVYIGQVQESESTQLMRAAPASERRERSAKGLGSATRQAEPLGQKPATACIFQVSGTNISSNQRVVFSGSLSYGTNGWALFGTNGVETLGDLGASNVSAVLSQPNLHLSGKAVIGRDQEVEIEAMSAPPPQQNKP